MTIIICGRSGMLVRDGLVALLGALGLVARAASRLTIRCSDSIYVVCAESAAQARERLRDLPGERMSQVVVVLSRPAILEAVEFMLQGVCAVVDARRPSKEFFAALDAAAERRQWLSPPVQQAMRLAVQDVAIRKEQRQQELLRITGALTERELEVTELVAQGFRGDTIARRLGISPITVRHHLTSINAKLGTEDKFGLALLAYQRGLAVVPSLEEFKANHTAKKVQGALRAEVVSV